MATKKKAGTAKKSRKQSGRGVTLKDAEKFIKKNRVLSKTLGVVPHPVAQVLSKALEQEGLGRRKRRKRASSVAVSRMRVPKLPTGGSVRAPRAVHTARLAIAPAMPSTSLAHRRALAHQQRGTGFFSDLGGGIGSVFGGLGSGIGSMIKGIRG